jgi:hypothetical protein
LRPQIDRRTSERHACILEPGIFCCDILDRQGDMRIAQVGRVTAPIKRIGIGILAEFDADIGALEHGYLSFEAGDTDNFASFLVIGSNVAALSEINAQKAAIKTEGLLDFRQPVAM